MGRVPFFMPRPLLYCCRKRIMRSPIFCLFLFLGLALQASVNAQVNHPAKLTRITGEQVDFPIESISDGIVRGPAGQVRLDALVNIDMGQSLEPQKGAIQIALVNGGELNAEGISFANEQFQIELKFANWVLSPESIRGVLFDPTADRSRYDRALKNRSPEKDVLIAVTKEGQGRVSGILETISETKVSLDYEGRSRSVARDRTVAIVTADLKNKALTGSQGSIRLVNGSILIGMIQSLVNEQLVLGLVGQETISIPVSQISSISLRSDRVVFLSDMEPSEVTCTPLVTLPFQWQRDLSVRGEPLRIFSSTESRNVKFNKGIGTHAASRLEFEKPEGFNRFESMVGIAAEMEGRGNCEVSVWGDGIELWKGVITGRDDPLPIDVDVTDMKKIALVVRNGLHLDLADHVNWGDARFLKIAP